MNNVIELKRDDSTFDHIQMWLDSQESENTKIRYKANIEKFINWKYKDIRIEHLQPDHFNSIRYVDMEKFKTYLRRKHSVGTVNNTLFSIYSLMKTLNKIQDKNGNYIYDINVDKLRVKVLKDTTKEDYGYVDWEEMDSWIEYLSSLPKRQNPLGKSMWIELSRLTGIRKQGLADLKFKDLIKEDGVYVLVHTLKGKKRKISIPENIAARLLELKKTSDPNEKILKMSTKTMERTFSEILKHFNIPPERNVVIHSMRGESGYEAYLASGNNPVVAKEHLGHDDFNTTLRYINKRKSVQESPTLYMGKKFSDDDVKNLDNEQWLTIYNKLSRSAKYEILNAMNKLGYSQE